MREFEEFKFRAWNKDYKFMIQVGTIDFNQKFIRQIKPNDYTYKFSEVILLQYSGLRDKNNREIYEGDIVKYFWSDNTINIGQVIYSHTEFTVEIITRLTPPNFARISDNLEIIGNIYENPELIGE